MAKTLNGITCAGYREIGGDAVEFSLRGTTVADAAALDGQTLEVKDGDKLIASYAGFEVTGVSIATDGESVRLRAARALEPQTEQAIKALEDNMQVAQSTADTAVTTAQEAKTAAETAQAAANPQVVTFASIALPSMAASITDKQAITISTLWPEWSADSVQYKVDDVVNHAGHLYRCEQAHTSQADWTPDASASLWSQIDIAGDGVDVWTQPTGAHNAYNTGDRVHYPTADDPIYVSLIDGNTWSPDAYPQGWKLETE